MPCQIDNIQCSDPTLQGLFSAVKNAISLSALVVASWRFGLRLTVLLIEEVLNDRAQAKTQWPNCPTCGKKLQSKGFVPRQITTIVGVICFRRRVGRCPARCQIGQIVPFDEQLQLAPHQRSCTTIQRLGCMLAVFVPFETASLLLYQLIGVKVSATSIWHWVANAGQRVISRLSGQLDTLAEGKPIATESMDPATEELPMLIGADGVMVPFRPERGTPKGATIWHEVKVAIVTRFRAREKKGNGDKEETSTELVQRRLVACLGNIDALGRVLWLESLVQGVKTAKSVVWISDGARGFWRLFDTYFASFAIGILDFYHAAENLCKAAKIRFDGRTKKARAWFESARHRLRHGPTMRVRMSIETALTDSSLSKAARKVLDNLKNYLDKHHSHIQYHQFKAQSLPIGSGMVESACKWLITQRFKQVGQRWSVDGFDALLHVRLAWINNRFDELFIAEQTSPN